MLNELIQANEKVFMNFWNIEHYGGSFGLKITISNISNVYSMYKQKN